MAQQPFHEWARMEIARLRAEADGLERALNHYLTASGQSLPTEASQPKVALAKTATRGRRKGNKTQAIVGFIQGTEDRGAALPDIYRFTEEQGLDMKKNSVRSILYFEKKKGRMIERDGRYFFGINGLGASTPSPSIQ